MAYSAAEGRQRIARDLAEATERLGVALAALGSAYESLDEPTADRLEEELFRPVQHAAGRARRTLTAFAARHGDAPRPRAPAAAPPPPSAGVAGAVAVAVDAVAEADHVLAELQDSMLPVEVGDGELRAGLSEVRRLLAGVPGRARELSRTLGR